MSDDPNSVVVTPLQPPLPKDAALYWLGSGDILAVSKDDSKLIRAILSGAPVGREIVIEAIENDERKRVRVSVVQ
jgi:hypothetical protein